MTPVTDPAHLAYLLEQYSYITKMLDANRNAPDKMFLTPYYNKCHAVLLPSDISRMVLVYATEMLKAELKEEGFVMKD